MFQGRDIFSLSDMEYTSRLMVQNVDWDLVTSVDLYCLVASLVQDLKSETGNTRLELKRVSIVPTELGAKMLKEEEKSGPVEYFRLEKEKGEEEAAHLYREKRKKYYLALFEFDSAFTAMQIVEKFDGCEVENTFQQLWFELVPDSFKPAGDPRDEATEVPEGYEPNFATALPSYRGASISHIVKNVDPVWDQEGEDNKAVFFRKTFTGAQMKEIEFQQILASDESEDEAEAKLSPEEYRKLLGLEDPPDVSNEEEEKQDEEEIEDSNSDQIESEASDVDKVIEFLVDEDELQESAFEESEAEVEDVEEEAENEKKEAKPVYSTSSQVRKIGNQTSNLKHYSVKKLRRQYLSKSDPKYAKKERKRLQKRKKKFSDAGLLSDSSSDEGGEFEDLNLFEKMKADSRFAPLFSREAKWAINTNAPGFVQSISMMSLIADMRKDIQHTREQARQDVIRRKEEYRRKMQASK